MMTLNIKIKLLKDIGFGPDNLCRILNKSCLSPVTKRDTTKPLFATLTINELTA